MVKNEEYIGLLKSMISCVNNGDYYSIKELSRLKLENMKKTDEKINKEIKKLAKKTELKKLKKQEIEDCNKEELLCIIKLYSKYILNKIEITQNIQELQIQTVSVEEFTKKVASL